MCVVWYGMVIVNLTQYINIHIGIYYITNIILSGDYTKNTEGARCHAVTNEYFVNCMMLCIMWYDVYIVV